MATEALSWIQWLAELKSQGGAARSISLQLHVVIRDRQIHEQGAKRRRIVPADGFYEWRVPKDNLEPLWIHPVNGGLLWFAAL